MAVARHVLIQRSKSQRWRSCGYDNRHGRTAVWCCGRVILLLPAWDCTSY